MGIEIVAIMAGFSFVYCIIDIIQNYRAKRQVDELLRSTVETEK